MSPRKKHGDEDVETEAGAEEKAVEMSAQAWTGEAASGETKVVAEPPKEADEVDVAPKEKETVVEAEAVTEGEKTEVRKVNLKTLASGLYQMGLDLGLATDEAALLTSETKLPAFIGEEGAGEFKQGLVEAYQEMLDERLQSLKQKLGVS